MSDKFRELLEAWRSRLPYKGSEWMEEHDVIKELADELEECLNDDGTTPTEPAPDREDVERFAGPITDENAAERISQMLMDVADVCGMYPEAVADPRAWAALILYCDDVTADLRRYHWLTSDLPTSLESSRRLNILRWMHVNGKGAIDAAIDAARQEQS